MKKIHLIGSIFLSFIFILMFNIGEVSAENLDKNSKESTIKEADSYTFGEVEKIIEDYLKSKGKNYDVGSPLYSNFIIDQYINGADEELANKVDYRAINAYLSEYKYQLLLHEEKYPSNLISIGSKLYPAKFDLGKIKELTIGELKEQISKEESAAENLKPNIQVDLFATTQSYSVSKAKSYAEKWYNGRNPAFPTYPYDCTNFVSQILFAGGMKMNTSSVSSGWYAETSYSNPSWRLVPEFFTYWSQRKKTITSTSKSTIISDAKEGDIIQLKGDGETRWGHSLFVYSKADSTLYLSAHSNDTLKKNFKKISDYWVNFRVIKM